MADEGHILTEQKLSQLEENIRREYEKATNDMRAKLEAYLEKTEAQRKVQESLLKDGKITKQEYKDWCYRHAMIGKRWEEMQQVLADDLKHADKIAKSMMKKSMPDIYALNCNYATYRIEHDAEIDTGFTLYNHDTAEYLLGDQRQLMPQPSTRKAAQIKANADMQWNKNHIQSAVLQGVLQGESPYDVAKRLQQVGQMSYNSAVRYARTMTTSAQNAGRYESFHRAKDLGVDLTIEWQATLDHRTRHAHRMMHGQRTEVDKPFHTPDGYTIYYPADCTGESTAPQHEIWNCRCTLLGLVKGYEGETVKHSPAMGDMTFEEWQNENAPKNQLSQNQASQKTAEEDRKKQIENSDMIKYLRKSGIERLEPERYTTIPSEEQIINMVCGGDETKGSCVSLAMAYAGNKNGLKVLDFRGGESQNAFSSIYGWSEIARRLGVEKTGKTDVLSAVEVLKTAEIGKQYILITGKHATVIQRLREHKYEYLELQNELGGWCSLDSRALNARFGCRKTARRSAYTGKAKDASSYMIDIEKLKGDAVFEEALCYINTDAGKRKMGKNGYAK